MISEPPAPPLDAAFDPFDDRPQQAIESDPRYRTARVPGEKAFGGREFLPGDSKDGQDLLALYAAILKKNPERFGYLAAYEVDIFWRADGGKARGKPCFGKAAVVSGEFKGYTDAHFRLWIGAAQCLAAEITEGTLEALLGSLLCGISVDERGTPITVPPDLTMHRAEVELYGLWRDELQIAAPVFRQAPLGL